MKFIVSFMAMLIGSSGAVANEQITTPSKQELLTALRGHLVEIDGVERNIELSGCAYSLVIQKAGTSTRADAVHITADLSHYDFNKGLINGAYPLAPKRRGNTVGSGPISIAHISKGSGFFATAQRMWKEEKRLRELYSSPSRVLPSMGLTPQGPEKDAILLGMLKRYQQKECSTSSGD